MVTYLISGEAKDWFKDFLEFQGITSIPLVGHLGSIRRTEQQNGSQGQAVPGGGAIHHRQIWGRTEPGRQWKQASAWALMGSFQGVVTSPLREPGSGNPGPSG